MFGLFKKKKDKTDAVKEISLYSVADGELIKIEEVNDLVFAQKMMGDGYAVVPSNGTITAPVDGKVTNVFPTQHAIGFDAHGLEILLHMGIDTVSLDGGPFSTAVREGENLKASHTVSEVDLDGLEQAGKDNAMIVIFTNGTEVIENFEITASGTVTKGQVIGKVTLK